LEELLAILGWQVMSAYSITKISIQSQVVHTCNPVFWRLRHKDHESRPAGATQEDPVSKAKIRLGVSGSHL
jgi:hypothetical protein